jgi:hypothetical protein
MPMAQKITTTFEFPTDPQIWQEWFTHDVNRSSAWLLSARDLVEHIKITADTLRTAWTDFHRRQASEQIAPPRGMHRIYLFLSAIAIENLLKAVLVNQVKWPDSHIAEKLPAELHSHMLLDLAAHGGLKFIEDEVELLERLTEFGIWLGRYPAPTMLHHTKPKKLKSGMVNLAGHMYGSDIRQVESLINKLLDKLEGVQGIEHVARFPARPPEDFEGYCISPNVRAW